MGGTHLHPLFTNKGLVLRYAERLGHLRIAAIGK